MNESTNDGDEGDDTSGPRWRVVEQRRHDPEGESGLATTIIKTLARAEETDWTNVTRPPLYDVVDVVDLENVLWGRGGTASGTSDGHVRFEYRGFRITVHSDGWVRVAEPDEAPRT